MFVISHIACTYLPKKAFEARLRDGRRSSATPPKIKKKKVDRRKVARDGRPKFRKARDTVEAKRSKVFLGKKNSSPQEKGEKGRSYSGRLLTASGGRQ